MAIPVCPVIGIRVYFCKRGELKELCPWIRIDPAVTDGTQLERRRKEKWSPTRSGCPPALTSARWAVWDRTAEYGRITALVLHSEVSAFLRRHLGV